MRPWEHKRAAEISEYILVTHISCLLVFLMIIFSFYSLPLGTPAFPLFPILVFVISASGIIVYGARKVLFRLVPARPSRLDEVLLLLVVYPLTFAFLWTSRNFYGAKVLLLIPTIILASAFGKTAGTLGASLTAGLLFLMDYRLFGGFTPDVFQTDLIVGAVAILLSWLMGGLMEVERRVQENLLKLADYDQLTGLLNHRALQERLVASLKEAEKSRLPLTVVLVDIDQFKYYNAVYGYQKGDEILASAGRLLLEHLPRPCYAARYANDEFALVFPGKDKDEALRVASDLKDRISQTSLLCLLDSYLEPPSKPFSLTLGAASFPEDADTALPLIRAAENDLFRAKSSQGKTRLYQSILSEICALKIKDAFPTLQTLVALINSKDRYTYNHSERVMSYALALANRLKLPEEDKDILRYGSYLHDLGKIEIESSLLNKDGPLNQKEWEIIKAHPVWGSELVRPLIFFQKIALVLRHHHENYDGSGYPDGLKGEEIPLLARIVRLADSFDAMTTDRPYRKALSFEQASQELKRYTGVFYDPELVDPFLETVSDIYLH